jgi:macrolide transport system ATP-binding/permease protein
LRMALGASPRLVRQLVWREALMLGGIGAAIGLGGSTAIGKVSQRFLFGLDGLDLMTLAGAVLLLLIVTLVAAYVPVRRAMRVDAVEMLKA